MDLINFFNFAGAMPKKYWGYRTLMPQSSACLLRVPGEAYTAMDNELKRVFEGHDIRCGMQNHHAYEFENGVVILFNDWDIRIDHISNWPVKQEDTNRS